MLEGTDVVFIDDDIDNIREVENNKLCKTFHILSKGIDEIYVDKIENL